MNILIISPSMEPYGGVRVILNWAKYLRTTGNEVTLCSVNGGASVPWFNLPLSVKRIYGWPGDVSQYDLVIATNPDTVLYLRGKNAKNKVYLCQMAEEMFDETNAQYVRRCEEAASVDFPMITVADWLKYHYSRLRTAPTYVVQNGIDNDFYYAGENLRGDKLTILVEGWESNNTAKDVWAIAPKAISALKEQYPVHVIAYGQQPLNRYADAVDEYFQLPKTEELNDLYNRAHFLVKASKYETRSLAPLEAMATGCIPIVSCIHGHPDVMHQNTGIRARYEVGALYDAIVSLINSDRKRIIQRNGMTLAASLSWQHIINHQIIPILDEISYQ